MNRKGHNFACHGTTPRNTTVSTEWSSCVRDLTQCKRNHASVAKVIGCSKLNTLHGSLNSAALRTRVRRAVLLLVRSTSSLPVAFAWGVSCLGTYRGVQKARAKPSGQLVATPTKRSKQSLPTSPTRFGLRTLRLRSPRFVAAAFVPLNAISADNENGRVSQSRSSSPRSCVVTPCAISRSFPNGSHRPF
jgi:hypothetical protein